MEKIKEKARAAASVVSSWPKLYGVWVVGTGVVIGAFGVMYARIVWDAPEWSEVAGGG